MHVVDESKCARVELPLVSCRSLLHRHGVPYVLKLDIEGHEQACLQPLPSLARAGALLPQYVSMEWGTDKLPLFPLLLSLGYQRAKMVNQKPFIDWSGP